MAKDVAREIMRHIDNDAWDLKRLYLVRQKDELYKSKKIIRKRIRQEIIEGNNILKVTDFPWLQQSLIYYRVSKYQKKQKLDDILLTENDKYIYYLSKDYYHCYDYITKQLDIRFKIWESEVNDQCGLSLDWRHWKR